MPKFELFAPDYDPKHAHTHHYGARLIGEKAGKIALLYYQSWQLYVLPGGGMHPAETAADAVRRETLEETGFQLTSLKAICLVEEHFADAVWHHHYFVATLTTQTQAVQWTPEEEKLNIMLTWHDPLSALELLTVTEGRHPYAENMMNREFLALSEAIQHLKTIPY